MNDMKWTITQKWTPFIYDDYLGGYVEVRDGMTFATIHGAGHMAAQTKRGQTYHVVFNFIQDLSIV